MKKRLLKIKYENIALILFIPLAINQFLKAHIDFKIASIMMSLILYGGMYLLIYTTRKEALFNVRNEQEKPILKPLINYIKSYINGFISIKKEIIKQARNINDQAYILRASFK